MTAAIESIPLTGDDALRIARHDAELKYKNISRFRIELSLEVDGWHIAYRPAKGVTHGGGPHYIIDATTGEILWKRYYQ